MVENIEKELYILREKTTNALVGVRDEIPVAKEVVNYMLKMQSCNDTDLLVIIGTRAIEVLQLVRSKLTDINYTSLLNTILSIAETEETRITGTYLTVTLH